MDEGAVRNTRDVDILIRREDLPAVRSALGSVGFDDDMFLDGPKGKPRAAVHLLFASEKVRPEHSLPAPRVEDSERAAEFQVTTLQELVQMKLLSPAPAIECIYTT